MTGAVLDPPQQSDEVVAPVRHARVARMLVLGAERLDERDSTKLAALPGRLRQSDELLLVAQVVDAGPRLRAVTVRAGAGVIREVVERLMMELEEVVRTE